MRLFLLLLTPILTGCSNSPPVSNLCGQTHPIKGFSVAEEAALTREHKLEIARQNCKIEQACGYTIDKGCDDA